MERPLLRVEDSELNAEALLRVARGLPLSAPNYLFQRGAYAGAPRPVLVLWDLNLPGIGGREEPQG